MDSGNILVLDSGKSLVISSLTASGALFPITVHYAYSTPVSFQELSIPAYMGSGSTTLLSGPATGSYIVRDITLVNNDVSTHVFVLGISDNGVVRRILKTSLAATNSFSLSGTYGDGALKAEVNISASIPQGDLTEDISGVDGVLRISGEGNLINGDLSIAVNKASSAQDGFISKDDFRSFSTKEPGLTKGDLQEIGSSVLNMTGNLGSVIGPGLLVNVSKAGVAHDGYLSKEDWASFNGKAPLVSPVFMDVVETPALKITTGASDGKIFTSDATGLGSWEANTGSAHVIKDAGTPVTPRANLNFVGATLTDDGSNTIVTVGGGGHSIKEEGGPALTQRGSLNFVGTNVTATDDSGNNATVITVGGVSQVSVATANGISGSVATDTTTPAITLSLGAITPSTVNALTLAKQTVGFTIDGGDTSKKLTVPLDASVSGTNTGDEVTAQTAGFTITKGTTPKTLTVPLDASVSGTNTGDQTLSGLGGKPYHGIVARSTSAGLNCLPTHLTTTTFTALATAGNPLSYYYQGTLVPITSTKTATLDDGAGGSTAGLYYVYFNAATGTLLATKNHPGVSATSNVIVASVLWNGTDYGLVQDERHGYNRDHAWHANAHFTIGCRYRSGLTLTASGTGASASMSTDAGEIWDEDIAFTVPVSSAFPTAFSCRLFWQTGASTYAFDSTPSTVPFKRGGNNRPVHIGPAPGYTLTEAPSANNRYLNFFFYASTDLHTPIYCVVETVSANAINDGGYTNTANARAIPFPNLSTFGLFPEMKPIYRVIVRADGVVQAISTTLDDYRTVSSLPMAAGNVATTASAVASNATTNITAINVQNAIEELDALAMARVSDGTITDGVTTIAPSQNKVFDALALKANVDNPTFTTGVTTPAIKITTGAGLAKVLTSDADGDATWETAAGSGHTIQDEGSSLTARANLNFVGPGVAVTDNGSNTTIVTIGVGFFEIDVDGGLQPLTTLTTDEYYELDVNDDIQPKVA